MPLTFSLWDYSCLLSHPNVTYTIIFVVSFYSCKGFAYLLIVIISIIELAVVKKIQILLRVELYRAQVQLIYLTILIFYSSSTCLVHEPSSTN